MSGAGGGRQGKGSFMSEKRQPPGLMGGWGSSQGAEDVVTGEDTFEGNLKR